ncbi:hypothetical protein, partial [Klebsiella pneumoniae]|uniref:hypothetical protein n=1 Tax=Klebsiella pneumoniae TaxID=573 RepID=UPI003B980696
PGCDVQVSIQLISLPYVRKFSKNRPTAGPSSIFFVLWHILGLPLAGYFGKRRWHGASEPMPARRSSQ